jgi:hypothetical protein
MAKFNLKSWILGIFIIQETCALNASGGASAMEIIDSKQNYSYSINFMWDNSKSQLDQRYIIPGRDADVQTKLLDPIIAWSQANPRASINLWYGGVNTSESARANTDELISRRPEASKIQLRDIRELPLVEQNPKVFSSKLPVYFRVDLARVIMLLHLMKNRDSTYAVYADLDTPVMDEAKIFDQDTIEKVNKYGIVLPKHKSSTIGCENSFHIVSRTNPFMLRALKFAIIDLNIKRGYWALREGEYLCSNGKKGPTNMAGLQEIVYDSYQKMFGYAYALEHRVQIRVQGYVGAQNYDPTELTHEDHFYIDKNRDNFYLMIPEEKCEQSLTPKTTDQKTRLAYIAEIVLSTKEMGQAPRSYNYNDKV